MQNEKTKETNLKIIHEMAKESKPISIDEVSHAFFNSQRVENWENLNKTYAGHKVGAIYSFVLDLVEKHIGESVGCGLENYIKKGA